MTDINKVIIKNDVEASIKLSSFVKWLKIILAAIICIAYFTHSSWLNELLVVAVVISLIIPLGFFDVFIQKSLEYNTQTLEDRIFLNAKEANEHFSKIDNTPSE